MTHDELLAKIKNTSSRYEEPYSSGELRAALRAVVELHMPNTAADGNICFCGDTYPCLTIQAIEKELG